MIKLPWKREAKTFEPKSTINSRLLELETAKQITEKIFHARPSDVEDMIQTRPEDKSRNEESWQEEEELWPREFCLGDWLSTGASDQDFN